MRFMNEMDIEDARIRWAQHPVLGPATTTLHNLMRWTNRNSDGWAYWPKPCRAAASLIDLIEGPDNSGRFGRDFERTDATPEALKAALRPLKAFRTRMQNGGMTVDFDIVDTLPDLSTLDHKDALNHDDARQALAANECGDPVGYRVTRGSAERCLLGCLAPGSSPHSHPPIVGYLLIGTTGYVEVDPDCEPRAVGTLKPL